MKKLIGTFCALALGLVWLDSAYAFWSYMPFPDHQDITKTALSSPNSFTFAGTAYSFSPDAIDRINQQHAILDGPSNYSPLFHFDSDLLLPSLLQMAQNREALNALLSNSAEGWPVNSPSTQAQAWQLMGFMLHAAEDFYSHSSWVDGADKLNPAGDLVGFGALTENTAAPTMPAYFTGTIGTVCSILGFPLLSPVKSLVTGYYPPIAAPSGACIHGNLKLITGSCAASIATLNTGNIVPGISHDVPCAYPLSSSSELHVFAKTLAVQEAFSLVTSIVSDLDKAKNSLGFCALLGLDPTTVPICRKYTVGVTVTGLAAGAQIVLEDNSTDELTVSGTGAASVAATFATPIASGAAYSVTVKSPLSSEVCIVSSGTGTVATANVTNVTVSCSNAYSIGVTVAGLSSGTSVGLKDSVNDTLTVSSASPMGTFKTAYSTGSSYSVSITQQPNGETCTPAPNATGIIASANINVTVSCNANAVTATAAISAGGLTTCALSSSGQVYCWGSNLSGAIGNGVQSSTPTTAPVQVTGIGGVVAISTNGSNSCAVTGAQGAWCWGNGLALGAGNSQSVKPFVPNQVMGTDGSTPLTGVDALSLGGGFACALTGGQVLCWGDNSKEELGPNFTGISSNVAVPIPNLSGVTAIAAGSYHACALTNAGSVLCWGDDTFGEIGDGNFNSEVATPYSVPGLPSGIVGIAAGWYGTCVITNAGAIWCWGYDLYGELGVGPPAVKYLTPMPVLGLASGAIAVSTKGYTTCAQIGGGMQCWGNEGLGLGNGIPDQSTMPATVVDPAGTAPLSGVASMSVSGNGTTCAVLSSGGVDCWGDDRAGQLGNGTTSIASPAHSTPPSPVLGVGGSGFLQL